MGHTGATIAAAAIVDSEASGEDRGSFLCGSNTVESLLMPEIRKNTSVVWNFSVDPHYTWHTLHGV